MESEGEVNLSYLPDDLVFQVFSFIPWSSVQPFLLVNSSLRRSSAIYLLDKRWNFNCSSLEPGEDIYSALAKRTIAGRKYLCCHREENDGPRHFDLHSELPYILQDRSLKRAFLLVDIRKALMDAEKSHVDIKDMTSVQIPCLGSVSMEQIFDLIMDTIQTSSTTIRFITYTLLNLLIPALPRYKSRFKALVESLLVTMVTYDPITFDLQCELICSNYYQREMQMFTSFFEIEDVKEEITSKTTDPTKRCGQSKCHDCEGVEKQLNVKCFSTTSTTLDRMLYLQGNADDNDGGGPSPDEAEKFQLKDRMTPSNELFHAAAKCLKTIAHLDASKYFIPVLRFVFQRIQSNGLLNWSCAPFGTEFLSVEKRKPSVRFFIPWIESDEPGSADNKQEEEKEEEEHRPKKRQRTRAEDEAINKQNPLLSLEICLESRKELALTNTGAAATDKQQTSDMLILFALRLLNFSKIVLGRFESASDSAASFLSKEFPFIDALTIPACLAYIHEHAYTHPNDFMIEKFQDAVFVCSPSSASSEAVGALKDQVQSLMHENMMTSTDRPIPIAEIEVLFEACRYLSLEMDTVRDWLIRCLESYLNDWRRSGQAMDAAILNIFAFEALKLAQHWSTPAADQALVQKLVERLCDTVLAPGGEEENVKWICNWAFCVIFSFLIDGLELHQSNEFEARIVDAFCAGLKYIGQPRFSERFCGPTLGILMRKLKRRTAASTELTNKIVQSVRSLHSMELRIYLLSALMNP